VVNFDLYIIKQVMYVGVLMETYVSLITGSGKPDSEDAVRKAIEDVGCKEIAQYVLMGQYDELVIFEAPDAVSAAAAVWAGKRAAGAEDSQSQTMRAFTPKDLEKLQNIIR
jgi:uncharacterized protein with GYD domain